MAENKIESRRSFLKNLGKAAGAVAFAVPFTAENLCFSKETLDQIEGDLKTIQVTDNEQKDDNEHNCNCYSNCGSTNYQQHKCECRGNCGVNYTKPCGRCECSADCGSHYKGKEK